MLFINLLPDIKLDFVRAQRVRRLLVLLSVVIVLCCFVISSFLFFVVEIQQPATIAQREGVCPKPQESQSADDQSGTDGSDAGDDSQDDQAASDSSTTSSCDGADSDSNFGILEEIRSNEEGNTILTIQNQLQTLPDLHQLKTRPDRLFEESGRSDDIAYLSLMIPEELGTIQAVNFDFETHRFMITGYSKDTSDALGVHATIRFMGYEECRDDQDESNRNSRIYPFRINDEPISTDPGTEQERIIFNIEGVFSEQLFDREISDENLKELGKVPEDAVDPAKLRDPNHPCKLPSAENNIDNPEFEKLEEWWEEE